MSVWKSALAIAVLATPIVQADDGSSTKTNSGVLIITATSNAAAPGATTQQPELMLDAAQMRLMGILGNDKATMRLSDYWIGLCVSPAACLTIATEATEGPRVGCR